MGRASTGWTRWIPASVAAGAPGLMCVLSLLAFPVPAFAVTCGDLGGVLTGDDVTLSVVFTCSPGAPTPPIQVDIVGNFTITGTGGIDCSGGNGSSSAGLPGRHLTVNVGGDFVIDDNGFLKSKGGDGGSGGPGTPG